MLDFRDVVVATLYANVDGVDKSGFYTEWSEAPQIMNTVKMTTIFEMVFEYNIPADHLFVRIHNTPSY